MLHAAAQCCIPATTTARGTKAGTFYQAKKKDSNGCQQATSRRQATASAVAIAAGCGLAHHQQPLLTKMLACSKEHSIVQPLQVR